MTKVLRPATIMGIALCLVAIAAVPSAGQDSPPQQAGSEAQPPQAQQSPNPSGSSNPSAEGQPTPEAPQPARAKPLHVTVAPQPIYQPNPGYSKEARWHGTQGVVRFRAVIGTDGQVKELTAISGHPLLVQAARDTVLQWKFRPGTLDGVPVVVRTEIDVSFALRPSPGDRANMVAPATVPVVAVFHPAPPYTDKARTKGREGKIVLLVTVDERGNVKDVSEASKKLGDGLDKSAIETVKTWKFNPATRAGSPVAVRITIPVNFHLPESPTQASPSGDSVPPAPGS